MDDEAEVTGRAPWWPDHVSLSPLQRLISAVIAIALVPGIVIGVLGMVGVLGQWAKGVGALAVVLAAILELMPLLTHWWRRGRGREPAA